MSNHISDFVFSQSHTIGYCTTIPRHILAITGIDELAALAEKWDNTECKHHIILPAVVASLSMYELIKERVKAGCDVELLEGGWTLARFKLD